MLKIILQVTMACQYRIASDIMQTQEHRAVHANMNSHIQEGCGMRGLSCKHSTLNERKC